MTGPDIHFVHRFVPAGDRGSAVTLLLLHGTGGNEADLLPLGRALAPGAALLSPRGKVLENGNPRFFRRLAEGVFDLDDLTFRASELAGFVEQAAGTYGFDLRRLVAVGYSNGANIGGALLLLRPGLLAGAILLRGMVPFVPQQPPELAGTAVFLGAARRDPFSPPEETERLAGLLRDAGAEVTVTWQPGRHELTQEDVDAAREWLSRWTSRSAAGRP